MYKAPLCGKQIWAFRALGSNPNGTLKKFGTDSGVCVHWGLGDDGGMHSLIVMSAATSKKASVLPSVLPSFCPSFLPSGPRGFYLLAHVASPTAFSNGSQPD